ncbi:hypothetical protein [Arcanobacterium canis]|uniref:LPXTG-motif cell wall anchor domain-containing protein n=1 Tax=Arcanobacterium canis TaxID=999183 RepID=A0ABY8G1U6_9ACTO|nr:hypothetical protein [Arcanobacterium canis]WFM83666.1 hypothetical protein P7079_01410 [Arcanobacterium canis]
MGKFKRSAAFGAAIAITVTSFAATPAFAVKVDYEADVKAAVVEHHNIQLSIFNANTKVENAQKDLAEAKKKLKAAQKKLATAMRKKDDTCREQAEVDKQWDAKEAASKSLTAAQNHVKELFVSLDKAEKKLKKAVEAAKNVKSATEGLSATLKEPARSESFAEKLLRYRTDPNVREATKGLSATLKEPARSESFAEKLLRYRTDPNVREATKGLSATLNDPARSESFAERLLRYKADPNVRDATKGLTEFLKDDSALKAKPSQDPSKKADPTQDPSKKAKPSQDPSKKAKLSQSPSTKAAPKMEDKSGLPFTGTAAGTFAGMSVLLVAGGAALMLRRKNA